MKNWLIILFFGAWPIKAYTQLDTAYKYTYRFQEKTTTLPNKVSIDSFTEKSHNTLIELKIKNGHGEFGEPSTISLRSNNQIIWNVVNADGKFDTTITPGNYLIEVSQVGWLTSVAKFSTLGGHKLKISMRMEAMPSLQWYDVYSKVKLSAKKFPKYRNA